MLDFLKKYLFIWPHWVLFGACGIFDLHYSMRNLELQHVVSSSPTRGGPGPPALGVQSLSHWTAREVPATLS